jgi:hypothetical protein
VRRREIHLLSSPTKLLLNPSNMLDWRCDAAPWQATTPTNCTTGRRARNRAAVVHACRLRLPHNRLVSMVGARPA